MAKHRILNSQVSYPDGKGGEKTADQGDVVDDLPKQSLKWLAEQGHIEEVPASTKVGRPTAPPVTTSEEGE